MQHGEYCVNLYLHHDDRRFTHTPVNGLYGALATAGISLILCGRWRKRTTML